ncbi:MAG: prolipoprotein diacylglyceryl transferase family protein [Vampirovibrionales bacterium]
MLNLEVVSQQLTQYSTWQWGYWFPAWHVVAEGMGYLASWMVLRHQPIQDVLQPSQRSSLKWWTLGGAILGAKVVPMLEALWGGMGGWWIALGVGKSLAGGLLGGIIGSEWGKKRQGITLATGDVLVYPLLAGALLGRLGCASTAVWDGMVGQAIPHAWWRWLGISMMKETSQALLPEPLETGVYWNMGSIEWVALVCLAVWLSWIRKTLQQHYQPGGFFYVFCLSYFSLRVLLEPLKHGGNSFTVVTGVSMIGIVIACIRLRALQQKT